MGQKIDADSLRALNLIPSSGSVTKRNHGSSEYPQLGLKVYIVGAETGEACFLGGVIEMFAKAGCKRAVSLETADLVVFTGGEDVDPQLYGEKAIKGTYFNVGRDNREMDEYARAVGLEKPMFGICRGMQFLHVMDGGKLYQDTNKHTFTHNIRTLDGEIIRASSMHHQMCIENDHCFPIAWAEKEGHSGRYETASKEIQDPKHLDLEGAVYPGIKAIAVQGHPEVGGYSEYTAWCLTQIKEFLEEKAYVMGSNSKTIVKVTS